MAASSNHHPASLPHPEPSKSFWHTEPSSLLLGHRSTRDLPSEADIVVIGSGMTGASVVWHLLEPYRTSGNIHEAPRILLLEAREVCWGATGRNGGHCQPLMTVHPTRPDILHFELLNHATVSALAGVDPPSPSTNPAYPTAPSPPTINGKPRTFPCEFVVQPSVHAYFSPAAAAECKHKLDTLAVHAPELRSHCTWIDTPSGLADLRLHGAAGAVVTDVAARMWPYKFVAGVLEDLLLDAEASERLNVQTWTPVTGLEEVREGGWAVRTGRGDVRAERVVLATNAYTSHLVPEFADVLVPCRGQMSALEPGPGLGGEKRLPTSWGLDGGGRDDYLIQRPNEGGGQLMFGGGGQYGNRIGRTDDSVIDENAKAYLTSALPEVFGLEDKAPLAIDMMWTGIMGYSRDGLAFVGPVPDRKGLHMAAGYTGHGMPNTWLCGKAVAVMLAAEAAGLSAEDAVLRAQAETRLPTSYLLTEARLEAARRLPTVLDVDRAEHVAFGTYRD